MPYRKKPEGLGKKQPRVHADAQRPQHGSPDSAGRALFRGDLQDALLAELDLRFHPIGALLAALRTP